MIDFYDGGLAALTIPKQTEHDCRTCERSKPYDQFGLMRGKRNTECLVCARERWTRNRRLKLETRKCLRCKKRLTFESFPVTMRNGKRRLGMMCVTCTDDKKKEDRLNDRPTRRRAPIQAPPGVDTAPGHEIDDRTGTSSSLDFSVIAQQMLYPSLARPRDYCKLTPAQRARVYAVTRELARRYSPLWRPCFDESLSIVDKRLRPKAEAFLNECTLAGMLPDVLMEYIATQLAAQEHADDTPDLLLDLVGGLADPMLEGVAA